MKIIDEIDDLKVGRWPFWKVSIVCGLIGGALGAFFALIGM